MTRAKIEKSSDLQRVIHERERAFLACASGQRDLPFEDGEPRNAATRALGGESVACMFADEFRVLEMRREFR